MRKLTKKIAAVVLSAVMVGGVFAGCSATKDNNEGAEKKTSYKIGICQLVQHTALDAATKGFEEAEVEQIESAGGVRATLGKRILRTQTAPVAGLTAIMLLTGNLE